MTQPFFSMYVIGLHGQQIADKVLEQASEADLFQLGVSEETALALANSLIRKAVIFLILIDDLQYGDIGFQVIEQMDVPEPSPLPEEIDRWLNDLFSIHEDDSRPPNAPQKRQVLCEVNKLPDQKTQRIANDLVERSLTDEWLIFAVHELSTKAKKPINFEWFDTGLTYMGCLQAAMLVLKDTYEKSCLRNYVSTQLRSEINGRRAGYQTLNPNKPS